MAESSNWYHDPKYQNYWQHINMIQKQSAEQAQIYEQYSAAHWRSVALGLHHENQMLHELVQQLLGMSLQNVQEQPFVPVVEEVVKGDPKEDIKSKSEEEVVCFGNEANGNKDYEYGYDEVESEGADSMEEYLKFVQETEKHRDRRDRERQLEEGTAKQKKFNPADEIVTDAILDRADDIATDFERLKKEMSELYGKDALKVNILRPAIRYL